MPAPALAIASAILAADGQIPSEPLADAILFGGVSHRLVISDLTASGLLGFFYRRLGSAKMGSAFLTAYATYLQDTGK